MDTFKKAQDELSDKYIVKFNDNEEEYKKIKKLIDAINGERKGHNRQLDETDFKNLENPNSNLTLDEDKNTFIDKIKHYKSMDNDNYYSSSNINRMLDLNKKIRFQKVFFNKCKEFIDTFQNYDIETVVINGFKIDDDEYEDEQLSIDNNVSDILNIREFIIEYENNDTYINCKRLINNISRDDFNIFMWKNIPNLIRKDLNESDSIENYEQYLSIGDIIEKNYLYAYDIGVDCEYVAIPDSVSYTYEDDILFIDKDNNMIVTAFL
jgi:hypothetical protein